jgi:L-fucose isomerase-like protein
MMRKIYKPLLGLCPIGKTIFSKEDALRYKRRIRENLDEWGVAVCDLDGVIDGGLVDAQTQVETAVSFFKDQKIDALFIPHCNFGTEGAAAMIAKKAGVPVLLWGPRDASPLEDGSRIRDTLCGMFATSSVLVKMNVPFTYINNCGIDDPSMKTGVLDFMKTAAAVKAMRNMHIGKIGTRLETFWSTISNESMLLTSFGIQIVPFDVVEFIDQILARASRAKSSYQAELSDIRKWMVLGSTAYDDGLINSLAMRDVMLEMADEYDIDAFAINNSDSIPDKLGACNGLGDSLLQDFVPVACECDIHGAVSSALLQAASSNDQPVFFPDIVMRHPQNDNAVLLWHGTAPFSLRHDDYKNRVEMCSPWIQSDFPPYYLNYRLKDGPLTVCRMDADNGAYRLGIGEGTTVPGPHTKEFYTWMEVNDWARWERAIIEGPYIHHCSCAYGHYAEILEEACKYIPSLKPQRYDIART